jgi:hypothetical protein
MPGASWSYGPHRLHLIPGDRLEVVQPDGGRALVIGTLDAVPEVAGGRALRIRVCDARVRALRAE